MTLNNIHIIRLGASLKRFAEYLFQAGVNGSLPGMGRLLLLLPLSFLSWELFSQVEIVPLTGNTEVHIAAQKGKAHQSAKMGSRNDARPLRLVMARNKQQEFCLDTFLMTEFEFESLVDLECTALQHSAISISGACITISTFNITGIQDDLICLEICDAEGECVEIAIMLEVRAPLPLPFIEDFSYKGPFPDPAKWLDRNVFINNEMAQNPPSIGVATFDGLNELGSPYGGDEAGDADVLTSAFFDLAGLSIQDNVYLSFYLQPKGNGLPPRMEDIFRLEFKDIDGRWVELREYPGITGNIPPQDSPEFDFKIIQLTNAFFHDNFQFRFTNVNSRSGIREIWHLDYLQLDLGRSESSNSEDIAFNKLPAPIIFPYTSMPYNHYIGNEEKYLNQQVEIGLFNHFGERALADPSWHVLTEAVGGDEILREGDLTLLELQPVVSENQRDLEPGIHNFTNPLRSDNWLSDFVQSADGKDSLRYVTTYTLNQDQENINNIKETLRNNTVSSSTIIKDYFAYDDGTAEFGLALISNPTVLAQIAVKYHAEVADSIQGFQVHFPYVEGDQSNLLFNFKIWIGELDDEGEDYRLIFQRPIYPDQLFDTLQGQTTYQLFSEETGDAIKVPIPAGDFYIGIQQVSIGGRIPMGYDRNNPQGFEYLYENSGQGWKPMTDRGDFLRGALMLRPVMGDGFLPVTTSTDESDLPAANINIFPNPSTGVLYFETSEPIAQSSWSIDVINSLGQIIQSGSFQPQINLQQPPGLYIVLIKNDQQQVISKQKIILR